MTRKILRNKPLVEAIFELRWNLEEAAPGIRIDPHYKVLIGGIYEKVKEEYSFHEQLSTAVVPDEIAEYVVQHRFRKRKDEWPLIQMGPGIITLNDTDGYIWEDFRGRISYLTDVFFETYSNLGSLKIEGLLLRYIDAIIFDYEKDDIFKSLKEVMKMDINIYKRLFEDTGVSDSPSDFSLRFSFPSKRPKGTMHLKFARGKAKERDALVWETMFQSVREDAPKAKEEITAWADEAHRLTDDWFFKIVEGELLRRFE